MKGLAAAVSFLTVVPLRGSAAAPTGAALAWFPVVGAAIGAAIVAADAAAGLSFAEPLRSALVVMIWVLVSGALHLDGWIDVCDGMAPGLDRQRALTALRDPRVGALGVVGGAALLVLKVAAVVALGASRRAVLLVAAVSARWAVLLAIWRFPYGRGREGRGWALKEGATGVRMLLGSIAAAAALSIAGPRLAVIGALVAVVATLGFGAMLLRRFGTLTGDAYGALIELVEVLVLVTAAAAA